MMARRRRIKKKPVAIVAVMVIAIIVLVMRCACSHDDAPPAAEPAVDTDTMPDVALDTVPDIVLDIAPDTVTVTYDAPPADDGVPHFNPESDNVTRIATHIVPGRLRTIFSDTNDLQLTAAAAVGFKPISDLRGAYHLKRPIVPVKTCQYYVVDSLWMSMPYLVPEAATLLTDISRAFCDTVKARGGGDYRLRVTSLTRTDYSVARLRRRNRAATEQSCHRYGTTFDVSWSRFDCRDTTHVTSLEDLKNVLAEIIYDKRQQGLCYAIFEHKSGCFHVTVRPNNH